MENAVKKSTDTYAFISEQAYLAAERLATTKSEYYKGEVFAMSGASFDHNEIFRNVYGALTLQLRGKSCRPYGSDLRIHIPENTLYTYPDISIFCDEAETTDEEKDNFLNPSVIIEILSPSTKDYDRGGKFNLYRSIKTLQEYVLIDATSVSVEIFSRNADNSWHLVEFKELPASFTIRTTQTTLPLIEVYDRVRFE
jgi:Uma2 family endonuclease